MNNNVIEVVIFPCSDAFSNNQAQTLGPALQASMRSPGCLQTYYGLLLQKEDDKQVGSFVAIWETYDAHKALMAKPGYNEAVQRAFGPSVAGKPEVQHIQHLSGDPARALSSPITEIVTCKVKEGSTADAVKDALAALGKEVSSVCLGAVWGESVEHPDTFIAVVGWASLEAQKEAMGPGATEVATALMAIAEVGIKHYDYAKYPKE